MTWLTTLFTDIKRVFTSPKVEAVEKEIEALIPLALPIVEDIASLTPNKTVQEVEAAYAKYGVPLAQELLTNAVTIGNALLNLAVTVLQKNHAPAAAVSILQTAVQLAVTGLKASAPAIAN